MFEHFTDKARRVVVFSQEEAAALSDSFIGTEHFLLALVREEHCSAVKVLASLGVSPDMVRQQVLAATADDIHSGSVSGHIPFTPRAKNTLELSVAEASLLSDDYVGTEHILLGLVREGEGVAAQVLERLGADLDQVRRQVAYVRQAHDD
jgi:ATP-dependent Clp protease ATP-binding subunit ClpC